MAIKLERLSALAVSRARKAGLYADGKGLYLQVARGGARSWIFRFRHAGRRRDMGLGSLDAVTLAQARKKATDARHALTKGEDPIEGRRALEASQRALAGKARTFEDCAAAYIAAHAPGWRNAKHSAQWSATLEAYAYPVLGKLSVADIEVAHVLRVLEPIWNDKPETASRVRGRVEAIISWAMARGYRPAGANPATWRGHLAKLLPARAKVRPVKHHPALPYAEIGAFMADLRAQEGIAARALEFVILTACRTSEAIGATWGEIDLDHATWTIPAARIKAGREHRVPLSAPAVAILRSMLKVREGEFVFPGGRRGRPQSTNALLALLKRMKRGDLTVHGFRSTFRDWAAERTNYPNEVSEQALAHAIGDKVEAAYRRGDLIEKRKRLMADWAKFCGTVAKSGNVVPMRRAR